MSQEFKTNLVTLKLDYLCRIDFRQWVRKFMFVRFATAVKVSNNGWYNGYFGKTIVQLFISTKLVKMHSLQGTTVRTKIIEKYFLLVPIIV